MTFVSIATKATKIDGHDPKILVYNILRLRNNAHQFADGIFRFKNLYENGPVFIQVPLKFVSQGLFDDKSSLVQVTTSRPF